MPFGGFNLDAPRVGDLGSRHSADELRERALRARLHAFGLSDVKVARALESLADELDMLANDIDPPERGH